MANDSGAPAASPITEPRRATRSADEAMLGGVAAGLASHLGVPVLWVRAGFVVSSFVGFFGVMMYAGLWMMLPVDRGFGSEAPGIAAATRQGKRPGRIRRIRDAGPLAALAAVGLGITILVSGMFNGGFTIWPLMIAGLGVAVLWRQADEAQKERWRDATGRVDPVGAIIGSGGWASYARIVAGIVLLLSAVTIFALRNGDWSVARDAVLAAVIAVIGIAIMIGPWVFRLASDLSAERAERIRSQERADVAAHLHDSVLQTLALIQKAARDPGTVTRLARSQERDLRSWLYTSQGDEQSSMATALRVAAAEVEDDFGVPVEVICVGDRAVPEELRPLVLATREAVVNAAKHSGASQVDVYAEVTAAGTEVFVRDRGAGFDQSAIPADRYGVRNSIIDRMQRHGGTATIRSEPGKGTEVRLFLALDNDKGDRQ